MENTKDKRRPRPGPGRPSQRRSPQPRGKVRRKAPVPGSAASTRPAPAPVRKRRGPTPAQVRKRQQPSQAAMRKHSAPLRPRRYDPDKPRVVYTPPKPFSRSRLLLQLTAVAAVALALSFGLSIFFKVEHITVSGAVKYDPWTVKEASGIELGDNLLSFGEAKASAKIKINLPYVDTVRIGIKLPDTVNIEIKEFDVVYAIQDAALNWWRITAEGRVVEKTDLAGAGDSTKILGVKLGAPVPGQQAQAQEEAIPTETEGTGPVQPTITVRASDRLNTALLIAQQLEANGILGDVVSVDVSDLGNLRMEYGGRFTVKLGDTTRLEYKIRCVNAAINGTDPKNTLKEYDSGTLDASFTIKEDQLIYQGSTD